MGVVVQTLLSLEQVAEATKIAREIVLPSLAIRQEKKQQVLLLEHLADKHRFSGDRSTALKLLLEEALPLAQQLADDGLEASIIDRVISSYLQDLQIQTAQKLLKEHQTLLEQALPATSQAVLYFQLANALNIAGAPEKAIETLRQRVLPNVQHDALFGGMTWHNLARAHRVRGDLREALHILRSNAMPLYQQVGDINAQTMGQLAIAELLHELGMHREATSVLRDTKALLLKTVPRTVSETHYRAKLVKDLATELNVAGRSDEARDLLLKELSSELLNAELKASLQTALTHLGDTNVRGIDVPEHRHTCAGPEVYDDPA